MLKQSDMDPGFVHVGFLHNEHLIVSDHQVQSRKRPRSLRPLLPVLLETSLLAQSTCIWSLCLVIADICLFCFTGPLEK